MASFKKEPIPEQHTAVWVCCQEENCNGWLREEFTFEEIPNCPLCGSIMVRSTKVLPIIYNDTRGTATQKAWRRSQD